MPSPIEFKTRDGVTRNGYCNSRKDDLAVTKIEKLWWVCHLPSGYALYKPYKDGFKTSADALLICAYIKANFEKELAGIRVMTLEVDKQVFSKEIKKLEKKLTVK